MIDGCVVINLPHRTDRWEMFKKQLPLLASLGLKVERMDAIYGRTLPGFGAAPWFSRKRAEKRAHAWGGKAGCTLSHRKAIELAKRHGWGTVLILEDDVSFGPDFADEWKAIESIMAEFPEEWIALYLYGHHPVTPITEKAFLNKTIGYELCGALSTTAYVLNGRHFEAVLKGMPTEQTIWDWTARHKTVDRWYSRQLCLWGRVFAIAPLSVVHLETPSDATTSGEPYDAPNFSFTHVAGRSAFALLRLPRGFLNRLALQASLFRYWVKKMRGL